MKPSAEESFENVYLVCFPKLVAYLSPYTQSRQDAEDIASHAMMILWKKWDTLESHTIQGMHAWLMLTARNLWMDETKKQRRSPLVLSLEQLSVDMCTEIPAELDLGENEKNFEEHLDLLSEQLTTTEAQLLRDKIAGQLSNEEIAARMGVSVNTIHIRWTRTKQHIAQIKAQDGFRLKEKSPRRTRRGRKD